MINVDHTKRLNDRVLSIFYLLVELIILIIHTMVQKFGAVFMHTQKYSKNTNIVKY